MTTAVANAVKSAKIAPKDAGVVALAKRYAALMDESAPAAKYRKPLDRLSLAVEAYEGDDAEQVLDAFETVRTALAEHSVASDLGPKLLAALTALGLVVGAKGGAGSDGTTPGASVKDELRARRATRASRAASVDASA